MNIRFSITELSRLTRKTRPTLYKYISSYELGSYDDIPYSFIQLFNLISKDSVTNKEIVKYCENTFYESSSNNDVNEVITLIKDNASLLDMNKVKEFIMEEIENVK